MTDILIRAEGLGKKYLIGHQVQRERYSALRDTIARKTKTFLRKASDLAHGRAVIEGDELEEIWALRDLSFEVRRGDVLGIIGRNGAGKSTLLKVLSRITEPTTGRVALRGRVASLLEVGTGFHLELTGRENIFLNGAILGMKRAEIRERFDEIVAFAQVEKFLDTPVKRYSSGMYVRLAFAVAAHLEPEILIVDEVLAVGDAEFQRKCLGKMRDVSSKEGRTVLFVSHNMASVSALCTRAIVLEQGKLTLDGSVGEAVSQNSATAGVQQPRSVRVSSPHIRSVSIDQQSLALGELRIDIAFGSPRVLSPVLIGVVVANAQGTPVFGFNSWMDGSGKSVAEQNGVASLFVEKPPIHPGLYRVSVWLGEGNENFDSFPDALVFEFISSPPLPRGLLPEVIGSTRVEGRFEIRADSRTAGIPKELAS
ncbi:MAG: ABC transporter ATP-binding protein [Thermoanaerobaculia bacterium]